MYLMDNVRFRNCNKLWLRVLFIFTLLTLQPAGSDITLGFLLPYNVTKNTSTGALAPGSDFASAIILAVQAITNNSSLLPGNQVTFVWNNTECNDELSVKATLYQIGKGVQGFIGPACVCQTTARVAAAYNIPMISYMCTNEKLSDKTLFPTFARTIPPISTLASPLYALMEHFNWSHVAIITQNNNQWAQCDALVGSLNQEGVAVSRVLTMQVDVHYNQSGLSGNFENLLQGAADVSRVIVLAMNYALSCQAINHAGRIGLNNGRFAFIMFDLDLDVNGIKAKNLSVTFQKHWNEEAFHSALLLSVNNKVSAEYLSFIEDVKMQSSGPPFYYPVHPGHMPPIYAAYLYDAVIQYAVALNTTGNAANSDGKKIVQELMDRTFHSVLGYNRYINTNGDVEFSLVLMDYRAENNGMFQEVGEFVVDNSGKHKLFLNNESIVWPNNLTAPSSGIPKCKACDEHCYNEGNLTIGLILPYKITTGGVRSRPGEY